MFKKPHFHRRLFFCRLNRGVLVAIVQVAHSRSRKRKIGKSRLEVSTAAASLRFTANLHWRPHARDNSHEEDALFNDKLTLDISHSEPSMQLFVPMLSIRNAIRDNSKYPYLFFPFLPFFLLFPPPPPPPSNLSNTFISLP